VTYTIGSWEYTANSMHLISFSLEDGTRGWRCGFFGFIW